MSKQNTKNYAFKSKGICVHFYNMFNCRCQALYRIDIKIDSFKE